MSATAPNENNIFLEGFTSDEAIGVESIVQKLLHISFFRECQFQLKKTLFEVIRLMPIILAFDILSMS